MGIMKDIFVGGFSDDGIKVDFVAVSDDGNDVEKSILTKEALAAAESLVDSSPSDEQKAAGNYRKGHVTWNGIPITIETAKGTYRRGKDVKGKPWMLLLSDSYGYIKNTESETDGDHVDVFICDEDLGSQKVFIVDQYDGDRFDEAKCIIGADSLAKAKSVYLRNYSDGWQGMGDVHEMSVDEFKEWLEFGDTSGPVVIEKFNPEQSRDKSGKFASGGGGNVGVSNKQTKSPAFKAWFGDSKVVDNDGNPLVVYHGTHGDDFNEFKDVGPSRERWGNKGHYFTSDSEYAGQYASFTGGDDGARTMPVFLSIKNPKIIDEKQSSLITDKQEKLFRSIGHDGVIGVDKDGKAIEFIVFDANQIKSAIANSGEFDSKSNDIRKNNPNHDSKGRFASGSGASSGKPSKPHLASATEAGVTFETGKPVTFPMIRNTEKAPRRKKDADDPYQQAIEPHGRYLLHDSAGSAKSGNVPQGWESGEVTFKNPLVVTQNTGDGERIYDSNSWKKRLAEQYRKKGKALSAEIAMAGHDGIVTVDERGNTSEIVDLRHLHGEKIQKMNPNHDERGRFSSGSGGGSNGGDGPSDKGGDTPKFESSGSLRDDLEFIEFGEDTTPELVQSILNHYEAEQVKFAGEPLKGVYVASNGDLVEWDGESNTFNHIDASDVSQWVYENDREVDRIQAEIEDRFNDDFWSGPPPLYHATQDENVEGILKDGIEATAETRGMSNKNVGSAVYTTSEYEEALGGSYGNNIFEIDMKAMKKDGLTPYVSMEPDIARGEAMGALANAVGCEDFRYDYESGMSPTTVVVNSGIPSKYLKLVSDDSVIGKSFVWENPYIRKSNPNHDERGRFASGGGSAASKQINSPEFKSWFGDSKVVTASGKPLVVYHGSGSEFTSFDAEAGRDKGNFGTHEGVFFTESPEVASGYASTSMSIGDKKKVAHGEKVVDDYEKFLRSIGDRLGLDRTPQSSKGRTRWLNDLLDNGDITRQEYDEADVLESAVYDSERDGYEFDQTPNVIPAFLKIERPKIIECNGLGWDIIVPRILANVDREKYDGIIFRNIRDNGDEAEMTTNNYFVFKPTQIKSAIGNSGKYDANDPNIKKINENHDEKGRFASGGSGGKKLQTSTPEFKAWFGDSKIVDSSGNPLVMYHGTNADVSEFRPYSHFGTSQAANDRYQALSDFSENVVGRDPGPFNVVPVYIKMENPLRLPDLASINDQTGEPFTEEELDEIKNSDPDSDDEIPWARAWEGEEDLSLTLLEQGVINIDEFEEHRLSHKVLEYLKELGYDGIVYENSVEDPGNDSYIVFDPSSVKSATGNDGKFDPGQKPIRKINENHDEKGRFASGKSSPITTVPPHVKERLVALDQGKTFVYDGVAYHKSNDNNTYGEVYRTTGQYANIKDIEPTESRGNKERGVDEYKEEFDGKVDPKNMPPLFVAAVRDGDTNEPFYELRDGHHRYFQAEDAGVSRLPISIRVDMHNFEEAESVKAHNEIQGKGKSTGKKSSDEVGAAAKMGRVVFHATNKAGAKSLASDGILDGNLNRRDSGFFGAGLYASHEPQDLYGKSIVAIHLKPSAKILDVGELNPKIPQPWHPKFVESIERRILAHRPDIDPKKIQAAVAAVTPGSSSFSHVEYNQEVGRFARSEGYDAVGFAHGQETVILNHDAVTSIKHVGGLKSAEKYKTAHEASKSSESSSTPAVQAWASKKFSNPEHAKAFLEWFGDSKLVDDNGEPLVIYHGTTATFNEFDTKKLGINSGNSGHHGEGIYASKDRMEAATYGGNVLELYASVKNPFIPSEASFDELKANGADWIDDKVSVAIDREWMESEIRSRDPVAADLFSAVAQYGYGDGWEKFAEKHPQAVTKLPSGMDHNMIADLASKTEIPTGDYKPALPGWIDSVISDLGIKDARYVKAYEHAQKMHWVTDLGNRSAEITAIIKSLGYDGVISGSEIVLFSSSQLKSATDNAGTFDPKSANIRKMNPNHDNRGRFASGSGIASASASAASSKATPTVRDWVSRKFSNPEHAQNFTKWFGDSKVVDKSGEPLTVYHGTGADFEEFSHDFMGSQGTSEGFGFYFTTNKSVASGYKKDGGRVMETFISIEKPLSLSQNKLTEKDIARFIKELDPDGQGYLSNWGDVVSDGYENVLRIAAKAEHRGSDNDVDRISGILNAAGGLNNGKAAIIKKTLGFDGIIVDKPEWGGSHKIIIPFSSTQIKSATENDGSYGTENKNIRKMNTHHAADGKFASASGSGNGSSTGRDLDAVQSWASKRFNDPLHAKAFVEWFGGSKVVSDNGEPLTMYHGTNADFNSFDSSQIGSAQEGKLFAGSGFYFADNKNDAEAYGDRVMEVFLRMENPLDMRDKKAFSKAFQDSVPIGETKSLKELQSAYEQASRDLKIQDVHLSQVRPGFFEIQWKIGDEWNAKPGGPISSLEIQDDPTGKKYAEEYVLPKNPDSFLWPGSFSSDEISRVMEKHGFDGAINDGSIGHGGDEYVVFDSRQIKSAIGNVGSFDPKSANIRKMNPNHDSKGRFASGSGSGNAAQSKQQNSPEFKAWFGDSKVVDDNGQPLIVYHGSKHAFEEFRTDTEEGQSHAMLDRALGSHFAEDATVSEAFTIGSYARPSDYNVGYDADNSWYRAKGQLHYDGIRVLINEKDGKETVEPYDYEKHGSTYGIRERHGDNARVAIMEPTGTTFAVYLAIKNPLVIVPEEREMDQSAIGRVVGTILFPHDRELFIEAFENTGRKNGGEVWDAIKSGKGYDGGKYESYATFEDVAKNFSGMLNGAEMGKRVKASLQKMGYDGIKYKNTSQNEVKGDANPWAWIAFNAEQVKSATGNSGKFDPKEKDIRKGNDKHDAKGRFASGGGAKAVTKTEAFKKWFGDSKIVDDKGEPLTLYHGTDKDFSEFENRGGKVTVLFSVVDVERSGFFFSPNREIAKDFGSNVIDVHLSIKNPADFIDEKKWPLIRDGLVGLGWNEKFFNHGEVWEWFDDEDGKKMVADLKTLGYDGAIIEEPGVEGGRRISKSYIAFDPTQIKSASGNSGEFDPKSKDIRKTKT